MTIEETNTAIKNAGGDINIFWDWMEGQTYGVYPDGTNDIYEYDVDRFIRNFYSKK